MGYGLNMGCAKVLILIVNSVPEGILAEHVWICFKSVEDHGY